jgi:hypothetical protein
MQISEVTGYSKLIEDLNENSEHHRLATEDGGDRQWLLIGGNPEMEDDFVIQMTITEEDEPTGSILVMNFWGTIRFVVSISTDDLYKMICAAMKAEDEIGKYLA